MRRLLAVLVVLAACGDDGNINPLDDAPPPPDSPSIDAPTTGVVTLTITNRGQLQADVKVYFQNADSTLVLATTTDASGVASATMDIGGFVTAIDPFPVAAGIVTTDIRTFAGVKPGDNLVLSSINRVKPTTNLTVLVPGDLAAGSYLLRTNCDPAGPGQGQPLAAPAGSGEPAGGAISLTGCGNAIDLVVETFDPNSNPLGTFAKTDVPIAEGATVDLTAEIYGAFAATTFSYSAVPANIELITVNATLATSRGAVVPFGTETSVVNGSAVSGVREHAPLTGSFQVNLSNFFGSALISAHAVLEWGAPTTNYVLPLGADFLMPDFTAAPVFDIATRAFGWSVAGSTKQPDFAVGTVSFDRSNGGSTIQLWDWEIAAPHGTNPGITLPTLPAPDDRFNPIDNGSTAVDTGRVRVLTTAKVPGGYDAIRNNVLSVDDDPSGVVAGATGQVVLERFERGQVGKRQMPRRQTTTTTR